MNDELITAIVNEVEERREELRALCADLVRSPSITPPGDTRGPAAVAERWLTERGHTVERTECDPLVPNLIVTVEGTRPGGRLIFNGHLDTMDPADESRWTVPVLDFTEHDGRWFGLGMGNMKGGVAALCLATDIISHHREHLAGSVVLTLVGDEVRFGDRGTAHLLATRPDLVGDAVISAEGSGWMTLAVAEKGVAWFDLVAEGPAGHASTARAGQTAVARLAAAICSVDALNEWWVPSPAGLPQAIADDGHPGRRVAVNVGIIEAGEARGMVAPRATARLDVRLPPGLGLDELDRRINDAVAPHGVTSTRVRGWEASWDCIGTPVVDTVAAAMHRVRGSDATPTVRHPASDVMRWRKLGVPGICLGPQPTEAAGIDDHARAQDVVDCAAVYAIAALSGAAGSPRSVPSGDRTVQ